MARRIVTDTFLTITGPGTTIKVCRALQDSNGNVAVWWKPKTAPQRIYTVGKAGLAMRGNLVGPDGTVYAFRRRGVSCTWAICKGKFTTKQVAAWWPEDGATAASPQLAAAADAADAEPVPDPVRERAIAAARASRARTRPVTASERRAARARARAARAAKETMAERRAAADTAVDTETTTETTVDKFDPVDVEVAIDGPDLPEDASVEDAPDAAVPDPAPDPDPDDTADNTDDDSDATAPPTNAKIRAWATDNGYQVSPRGKIPEAVRAAYANAEQAGA